MEKGAKNLIDNDEVFVKELLWNSIIKKYLKKVEVDEIRRIIGNSLIEENEDYFNELKALVDILGTYQKEAVQYEKKIKLVRVTGEVNILKKQINELSKSLKKKSLKKLVNKKEAQIIFDDLNEFKPPVRIKTARGGKRPSSTSSSTSIESDVSSASSTSSDLIDLDIEKIKPDLNVFKIKNVVDRIRNALECEKKLLIDDIEFMRNTLENEIDYQKKVSRYVRGGIPSVDELVLVEKKMKNEVEKEEKIKFIEELPVLNEKKKKLRKLVPVNSENHVLRKKSKKSKKKMKKQKSLNDLGEKSNVSRGGKRKKEILYVKKKKKYKKKKSKK